MVSIAQAEAGPRAARLRDAVDGPALALAALAVGVIVVQAELRTPLALPGHRGVLWLGALVAVALLARRPGTVTATGLVGAGVVLGAGLAPNGLLGVLPYVLAAVALDALVRIGAVERHPLLLAALAAPVHLVGVVVPLARSVRVGVALPAVLPAMATVIALHLVFGLLAGLAGWAVFRLTGGTRRPHRGGARPDDH